jgi:ATP-dependent exoDNAse (exonuclease V) alpha subunit
MNNQKLKELFKHSDLIKLSTECQRKFYDAYFEDRHVFVTGPAGVGKSFALRGFCDFLSANGINVAITATTGIAAYNIGGQTLHSWAGIGLGDVDVAHLIEKVKKNKLAMNRIMETEVLVIDEVSMLKPDLLSKLEQVFQVIRFSRESFGGIQMIFSGDVLQLPPVWKYGEEKEFFFDSDVWKNANPKVIYLKQIMRQINQPEFIDMLNNIRVGKLDKLDILKSRVDFEFPEDGIDPVFIYCKNEDVDFINEAALSEIEGESKKYHAKDTGNPFHIEFFNKHTPIPATLEVKVGAQVVLLKNIDVPNGLVNGSVGKVTGFAPDGIKVLFRGGEYTITEFTHELKEQRGVKGKLEMVVVASRTQIPLKLAFALTVHKCQGMTLDKAVIDVSSAFAEGMVYVALSRVRDLDSMSLTGFSSERIRANNKCMEFYKQYE